MSVLPIAPHARPEDSEAVEALSAAIGALPEEAQDAVWEHFYHAVVRFDAAGEIDPLLHFARSLLLTARLHRVPAYREADTRQDLQRPRPEHPSLTDLIAHVRDERNT